MADVDAALVQQVLGIAERQRKSHGHQNRQPDDLQFDRKNLKGASLLIPIREQTTLPRPTGFTPTLPASFLEQ
ncbi:hypothetical protein SAMN04488026_102281 [Aliiruegeria lutimaris]|uniref:Uncharacterized protein n=1 Tax=Aliiruegeria lutimaris TaxID=571298 RepID=A0A1G8VYV7_9RHOB|nr:hypothetical protein SAMN04488026_102281 [Aliiruegeria lutimaris]